MTARINPHRFLAGRGPGRTGFKEYIRARRVTDTRNGDFVADAKADRHFPDPASWHQLAAWLVHRHACREAIAAARRVWNAYLRRHGTRRPYPPGAQAAPAQEEPAQ